MNNIKYREDQLPIINYESGTMAVPAVPGAGKTFIVTNLVAKLLREGKNDGKKILILTYMNSAVNNFKGRIKKLLEENEKNGTDSYEVMTIHSLAIKIIRENPEAIMLSEDFNIADDLQKNMILTDCINNFRTNGGERSFSWFVKEQKDPEWRQRTLDSWENGFFDIVINAISQLKYKEITPEILGNLVYSSDVEFLKVVYPIYKQYDKKLKQNGLLDYDDILIFANKALQNDESLRAKFENRYKYIFEDECQDSNEIQGKIIKQISEKNNNLVRVGDVNQSITGTFSSSDPKFFKQFMEEAQMCYKMYMSGRSSKDVLDLANKLAEYVTCEFKQEECRNALEYMDIKTVPEGEGYKSNPSSDNYNINIKLYKTWNEEIENTVRYVKGINKKYPDKSIGILVPFNNQVTQIAEVMSENKLEFEELGPNSAKKRKVINKISSVLDFILNSNDVDKLLEAIKEIHLDDYSDETSETLIDYVKHKNYSVEELLYGTFNDKSFRLDLGEDLLNLPEGSSVFEKFKESLKSIREVLGYPRTRIDLLIMYIGDSIDLSVEESAIVDYISFYAKYLCTEDVHFDLSNLHSILADSKSRMFSHIIDVVYEINGYEPEPGSITICNYHKSKGLEWDCVFLLGLTEYNFPDNINQKFQGEKWFLKEKYKNPVAVIKSEVDEISGSKYSGNHTYEEKISLIDEKIRLLYVGITRAKEMLILSSSAYRNDADIGRKNKEQAPCDYIKELGKYIISKRTE
ncbi:ATP-dependent helicase [Metaclostridioides mangenotii]|uniref:ATP-dependent helicase n=1 Tax=Metaclostridioides mangenotii TaxID=1540 RepID=UPI0026EC0C4E|nr:ATP-dependent helicase [Clostridioides mangenotii]